MPNYAYNPPRPKPVQTRAKIQAEEISFPWGIFFIAGFFDLIGLIPILNLITDILAGGILWFWQKTYDNKSDPLASFLANKITDFVSLGLWPSNIGMVITAYIQKKIHSKEPSIAKASAKPATA